MKRNIFEIKEVGILVLVCMMVVYSCQTKTYTPGSYDESLDDLVKGIYFGMEKEDFYKHCWDLNQEGETNHGTIANMVMYVDSVNFTPKSVINFYPKFEKGKISELPMIFYYHSWAPWNKNELQQDSLQQEVVRFFENKYEVKFDKKLAREDNYVYYKSIGPLLVRVYNDIDEMMVKADIRNAAYTKLETK